MTPSPAAPNRHVFASKILPFAPGSRKGFSSFPPPVRPAKRADSPPAVHGAPDPGSDAPPVAWLSILPGQEWSLRERNINQVRREHRVPAPDLPTHESALDSALYSLSLSLFLHTQVFRWTHGHIRGCTFPAHPPPAASFTMCALPANFALARYPMIPTIGRIKRIDRSQDLRCCQRGRTRRPLFSPRTHW